MIDQPLRTQSERSTKGKRNSGRKCPDWSRNHQLLRAFSSKQDKRRKSQSQTGLPRFMDSMSHLHLNPKLYKLNCYQKCQNIDLSPIPQIWILICYPANLNVSILILQDKEDDKLKMLFNWLFSTTWYKIELGIMGLFDIHLNQKCHKLAGHTKELHPWLVLQWK